MGYMPPSLSLCENLGTPKVPGYSGPMYPLLSSQEYSWKLLEKEEPPGGTVRH